MNIINAGTQYGSNQNEADQEFDDYLANLEDEHEPHVQKPPPVQEKNHSTNKNNLFKCDEDSNIFLQLYIVVHYYIFPTNSYYSKIFLYKYILYLSKLLHFFYFVYK
jgi:hypothetical protein